MVYIPRVSPERKENCNTVPWIKKKRSSSSQLFVKKIPSIENGEHEKITYNLQEVKIEIYRFSIRQSYMLKYLSGFSLVLFKPRTHKTIFTVFQKL